MKKKKIGLYIGGALLILLAFLFYLYSPKDYFLPSKLSKKTYNEINKSQKLEDNSKKYFYTKSNKPFSVIRVLLDDREVDTIRSGFKWYEYGLDLRELEDGWHYLEFQDQDNKRDGIFINKVNSAYSFLVKKSTVEKARLENRDKKRTYDQFFDENKRYSATGPYWGIGEKKVEETKEVKFDKNKIPMVKYKDGTMIYQPTTICQFALSWYRPEFKDIYISKAWKMKILKILSIIQIF